MEKHPVPYKTVKQWQKRCRTWKRTTKNIPELKSCIVDAWKNIDMEETKRAVLSWEHRLKMCVQEKGDRFEHKL